MASSRSAIVAKRLRGICRPLQCPRIRRIEAQHLHEMVKGRALGARAQKQLAERGIASRVVSVPSLELLLAQPADRQRAVIGNAPVKVAIEAAVRFGWDAVIGHDGAFIGMHGFGESGPAKDLFKHFGITAEAAVNAALKRLG